MRDSLYENVPYSLSELKHFYGPNVHLVGNPYLLSLLATLCAKDTQQPQVNTLVRTLYADLVTMVVNAEFPRRQVTIPSRMIQYTPRGIYQGEILDPEVRAISVNIARAGTLPSQVTYDLLNTSLVAPGRTAELRVDAKSREYLRPPLGWECRAEGRSQDRQFDRRLEVLRRLPRGLFHLRGEAPRQRRLVGDRLHRSGLRGSRLRSWPAETLRPGLGW